MKKIIVNKTKDPCYDGIDPLIARILAARGMTQAETIKFLYDGKESLHNPLLLKNAMTACQIIEETIKEKKHIVIFGDYDADGICATAILHIVLSELGAQVKIHLPDRVENGYGLTKTAVDNIKTLNNCSLMITVDNGTAAVEEISYAKSLGMETIILDHHQPGDALPNCGAIVNPHQIDDEYPCKNLSGAGVVFKIAELLYQRAGYLREHCYRLLDLAAIGTVADVVPLMGENRIIVKEGINLLRLSPRPGIEKLLSLFNMSYGALTSGDIAFKIAPAINATGRLQTNGAISSLAMVLSKNERQALKYANVLFSVNNERKLLVDQYLQDARNSYDGSRVHVYYNKDVPEGILGLIAAKMKEELSLPVIALSEGKHDIKGSARSVQGFDIFKALAQSSSALKKFGGHPLAAGLSMDKNEAKIKALKELLNAYAENSKFETGIIEEIKAEMLLPQEKISLTLAQRLSVLEPFGEKNPNPIFFAKGFRTSGYQFLSDKKHVKLFGNTGNAIGFGLATEYENMGKPEIIDMAVTLKINSFNGKTEPQLEIAAFGQPT